MCTHVDAHVFDETSVAAAHAAAVTSAVVRADTRAEFPADDRADVPAELVVDFRADVSADAAAVPFSDVSALVSAHPHAEFPAHFAALPSAVPASDAGSDARGVPAGKVLPNPGPSELTARALRRPAAVGHTLGWRPFVCSRAHGPARTDGGASARVDGTTYARLDFTASGSGIRGCKFFANLRNERAKTRQESERRPRDPRQGLAPHVLLVEHVSAMRE